MANPPYHPDGPPGLADSGLRRWYTYLVYPQHKGCSAKLQAHVLGNKLLQKMTSPMSLKNVCALKDAAFGKAKKKVPLGADD
jgi:hypothetical protein